MTETIIDLRKSAETVARQTDARLFDLTSSSALDAASIRQLTEQNAHLTVCNQKWDLEGTRLRKDNKRLRMERDHARALSSRIVIPRSSTHETSSLPLTPPTRHDLGS